jgi:pilus assembly protein Flp/PilA
VKPTLLQRLRRDIRGATAIEYGLIASLIVIAIVGSLNAFAGGVMGKWNQVDTAVQESVTP